MKKQADFYIHNRFDIFIENAKTGEIKQVAQAENILLNQLWTAGIHQTYDGGATGYAYQIRIGTGSGTLAPTRTTLFSQIAALNGGSKTFSYNAATRTWTRRTQATITETQHVGAAISEIGLGTINSLLCTHAMLKDMNGNPVIINKTNLDIITFYATTYAVIPEFMDDGSVHIIPNIRTRLVNVLLGENASFNFSGASPTFYFIEAEDFVWFSTSSSAAQAVVKTGVGGVSSNGGKTITFTPSRLAVGEGNVTSGIYAAMNNHGLLFRFQGSSGFSGSTIVGESLGTGDGATKDYKTVYPWPLAGAIVKIDGVVDNTATVDLNKPYSADLTRHLRVISASSLVDMPYNPAGTAVANGWCIFENPYYATYGIHSIQGANCLIYASDDMETWDLVNSYTTGSLVQKSVHADYQYKRYWKRTNTLQWAYSTAFMSSDLTTAVLKNVHFVNPPAEGAVLTIDYTTSVVAKTANHVFDCSFSITLDEYTPT